MKKKSTSKAAISILISGLCVAGLGFGINLFTLFNVYDKTDDPDCRLGSGCNVDDAVSTLTLGKGLTYFGVTLIILGAVLFVYSFSRKDKK